MVLVTPSLLITDDDRDFRETLRDVFEPRGFRTLLAGDGEEALDVLRHESVHVVLLDMHMPRLSGLDTIRRLQQLQALIPCILISAALDDTIIEAARQANAFSVLAKPLRCATITDVVNRAMRLTYAWPSADVH